MIGIIVAMKNEFELMLKLMSDSQIKQIGHLTFAVGNINRKPAVLMQCGMGKVCAAIAAREMIEQFHPQYIINTGLAGGLDTKLSVMDIVVGKDVVYHDVWCGEGNEWGQVQGLPRFFDADRDLYGKAMSLKVEGLSLKGGLQISGDRFINAEDVPGLRSMYPEALAVDMESGALAQTCFRYGVPFISFRIISDGCDESTYNDFWTKAPENSFRLLRSYLDLL